MGKMKTKKSHDLWLFDDFADFLKTVETTEPARPDRQQSNSDNEHFMGTKDYAQALDLAHNGWPQGHAEFTQKLTALTPYVTATARQPSEDLSMAGYAPDVPAYCAGAPAHMYSPDGDTFAARTPVLRMLVNRSVLAIVKAESIMRRGAAVCAVADYFESLGLDVEIDVCMLAKGERQILHEVHVPVKRAGEHYESDRMAFVLAHPSMHRRFGFRLREANADVMEKIGLGYGRSTDAEPDADQIYFPCLTDNKGLATDEEALATVLANVAEYLEPELKARVAEDWADFLIESRVAL